jgi:hypothetical protein
MTVQTFPLTGPINLQCRLNIGSLTVHARDNLTEARVDVVPRDPGSRVLEHVTVTMQGPTLVISGPRPRGGLLDLPLFGARSGERDALDITAEVPSGTAMKITCMAVDLTVTGRVAGADIAGGSTTVEMDEVDGNLRLRTGSGAVRLRTVNGAAVVRSGSSDVAIETAHGAVEVAFGGGSLHVGTARGPVRFRAGSGAAEIGTAHADVDLTTGTGALSVGVPSGQQARLDVVTGLGKLTTEMPVEQTAGTGGRALTIRARTGSGDVTVRRGTPSASVS